MLSDKPANVIAAEDQVVARLLDEHLTGDDVRFVAERHASFALAIIDRYERERRELDRGEWLTWFANVAGVHAALAKIMPDQAAAHRTTAIAFTTAIYTVEKKGVMPYDYMAAWFVDMGESFLEIAERIEAAAQ